MKFRLSRPLLLAILTTASMVIGAKLHFTLNGSLVTFQTFFLCLTALFFKPTEVLIGQILYLVCGFFIPVFASEYTGMAVLGGRTAGYLYAFPIAAFVLAKYGKGADWFGTISWTVMAHAIILLGGFLWLILKIKMDTATAWLAGVIVPLPGAFIKGGFASLLFLVAEKFLPKKS